VALPAVVDHLAMQFRRLESQLRGHARERSVALFDQYRMRLGLGTVPARAWTSELVGVGKTQLSTTRQLQIQ